MPYSAASDLGLHCLPMSLLWDTRLKWVNARKTTVTGINHSVFFLFVSFCLRPMAAMFETSLNTSENFLSKFRSTAQTFWEIIDQCPVNFQTLL